MNALEYVFRRKYVLESRHRARKVGSGLTVCPWGSRSCSVHGGEMGLEAENGQPAPPARRARVPWYPTGSVPAATAVLSPPPRGEGASGTPWVHFEWGIGGNWGSRAMYAMPQLRLAACTGVGWNSRHALCLREPADPPPVTHRAERRQLRGARQLRARCEGLFPEFGQFRKTYGFVVRKQHVPVHILSVPVHSFRRVLPTSRDRFLEGGGMLLIYMYGFYGKTARV